MSPLLFNLYSEHIFQEALSKIEEGVKVNGVSVNNMPMSLEKLQSLINKVTRPCDEYGLKVNTKKI